MQAWELLPVSMRKKHCFDVTIHVTRIGTQVHISHFGSNFGQLMAMLPGKQCDIGASKRGVTDISESLMGQVGQHADHYRVGDLEIAAKSAGNVDTGDFSPLQANLVTDESFNVRIGDDQVFTAVGERATLNLERM